MMLIVVNSQRPLTKMRLEGVVVVRQRRQFDGHGSRAERASENMSSVATLPCMPEIRCKKKKIEEATQTRGGKLGSG